MPRTSQRNLATLTTPSDRERNQKRAAHIFLRLSPDPKILRMNRSCSWFFELKLILLPSTEKSRCLIGFAFLRTGVNARPRNIEHVDANQSQLFCLRDAGCELNQQSVYGSLQKLFPEHSPMENLHVHFGRHIAGSLSELNSSQFEPNSSILTPPILSIILQLLSKTSILKLEARSLKLESRTNSSTNSRSSLPTNRRWWRMFEITL